ncbi:aldehyde dehydrogenase family protein [Reinekea sp. G2M2-21]|uniref:aldehyde dehydrogenase family protein n=1 Tax=Reinekea sp. G2M2-21 TaxID=2788942 RepID=UPI0018AB8A22|nr:aldehyde dehydrogenase family protein [Reinekea sp. G2M2-21]
MTNVLSEFQVKLDQGKSHFIQKQGLFIGGEWVQPKEGNFLVNTSPLDGSKINEFAVASASDVAAAVAAAREAQPGWASKSAAERAMIFLKIADKIEKNQELLALVETIENGKPIRETTAADLPLVIEHFRLAALDIRGAVDGDHGKLENGMGFEHHKEPYGVVGACSPFNFPLLMPTWMLVPALLTGNTMVIKIAEQTPASFMVMVNIIKDLLPAGVLNVLTGEAETGQALIDHPDIDKLIFTGSTEVGKIFMHAAAEKIIPVTVELGGKSPVIICEDAWLNGDDARKAQLVEGALLAFFNQGEVCTCGSRLLVQNSIKEEFLAAVLDTYANGAVVRGNPFDPSTTVGAQVDINQYKRVQSYLELAKKEGGKILAGGRVHQFEGEFSELNSGFYIEPTLIDWEDNSSRCMQEEIFGPVVGVVGFDDMDEALAIANDSAYGLGASIWTDDMVALNRAKREIQAGRIWVNTHHNYNYGAKFGGYKQSGVGGDTYKGAFDEFLQVKAIVSNDSREPLGFFVKS